MSFRGAERPPRPPRPVEGRRRQHLAGRPAVRWHAGNWRRIDTPGGGPGWRPARLRPRRAPGGTEGRRAVRNGDQRVGGAAVVWRAVGRRARISRSWAAVLLVLQAVLSAALAPPG